MTYIDLKKILLVSSVSIVAAFGLSACGDNDKATAPAAAMEETTAGSTNDASSAMDEATEMAGEKVEEVVEDMKEKAADAMDEAKQNAMDGAKQKAAED